MKKKKKEKEDISCAKIQAMITDYIKDKLPHRELEMFLQHIAACEECREELGVYYTILIGMEKLDADENISMDFTAELKQKLKRSEEKIIRYKRNQITKRILVFAIIISWICIDFAVDTKEEPEESHFELEEYFFRNRDSKTEQYVKSHYQIMMEEKFKFNYMGGMGEQDI